MLRFHSKVIWIVGGRPPTYGLSSSFTAVQAEVCSLLRVEGQIVWTGAPMVVELANWPHYRKDGKVDKWHFEENGDTKVIVGKHMLNLLRFVSSVYLDLYWMIQNKQNVEISYARALRKYPLKEPISLVPKFGSGLVRYDYAGTTPVAAGVTLQHGQASSPMQVSP